MIRPPGVEPNRQDERDSARGGSGNPVRAPRFAPVIGLFFSCGRRWQGIRHPIPNRRNALQVPIDRPNVVIRKGGKVLDRHRGENRTAPPHVTTRSERGQKVLLRPAPQPGLRIGREVRGVTDTPGAGPGGETRGRSDSPRHRHGRRGRHDERLRMTGEHSCHVRLRTVRTQLPRSMAVVASHRSHQDPTSFHDRGGVLRLHGRSEARPEKKPQSKGCRDRCDCRPYGPRSAPGDDERVVHSSTSIPGLARQG